MGRNSLISGSQECGDAVAEVSGFRKTVNMLVRILVMMVGIAPTMLA